MQQVHFLYNISLASECAVALRFNASPPSESAAALHQLVVVAMSTIKHSTANQRVNLELF